jgi:hypothetical protein
MVLMLSHYIAHWCMCLIYWLLLLEAVNVAPVSGWCEDPC